jgi:hypothetical protein
MMYHSACARLAAILHFPRQLSSAAWCSRGSPGPGRKRGNTFARLTLLPLIVAVLAAGVAPAPANMVHRYSFSTDASDSVGTAHGVLMGGANISGGQLLLDGLNGFVALPNNLVTGFTSITIEAWVTDFGSGNWARIYDFGNSTAGAGASGSGTQYMFLSLPSGGGNLRGAYTTTGGGGGEQLLQWPGSGRPPAGHKAHIVWTTDGTTQQGRLYVDGELVGANNSMSLTPAALGPTVNNWLGRSQWSGDAYFFGALDEFRIYSVALPESQVGSNFVAGPNVTGSGPARFVAQPQNQTVTEGDLVTFSALVDGTPPVALRWYRNNAPVPGATNAMLTFTGTAADNNAGFRLWATNVVASVTHVVASSNAVLTVLADTNPPVLLRAQSISTNGVEVLFSEPVLESTATNLANYTLTGPSGPVALTGAGLDSAGSMVTLPTPPLTVGEVYTLTVSNVRDRSPSANLITPGSQASFVATRYTLRDIGEPDSVATTSPAENGFALSAAGTGIGGTSDQFGFAYETLTGDFDRQLRVSALQLTGVMARAGLMARDGLAANAVFAASLATPGPFGCFFETRPEAGGASVLSGNFPVNPPYTWLRLQRAGNVFTGYASFDGLLWTPLGAVTLSAPATLQVGLAVSSQDPAQATVAELADAGPVSSMAVGMARGASEPLGPSSRRTALVISEIMHQPAPDPEGRGLEFVELYNAGPVTEDLGGFRLEGAIAYTFPAGTTLQPGAFLVVAKAPADIATVYGLPDVQGPYDETLARNSGTVHLRHRAGAMLLEAEYSTRHPWPAAAVGAGHSLVLARPSFGEGSLEAWSASSRKGGSPGTLDPVVSDPLQAVVINEFLAHTDLPLVDFIELYNHSNDAVDLSGAFLSDRPDTNKFQIPNGTIIPARGFVVYDQTELGFALNTAGEAIYFTNPDNTRVIDAIIFDAQANAVSMGRSPDGAPDFCELAQRTPAAPNSAPLLRNVVINEIMFNPLSGLDEDTYVELHNRGAASVDLSNWRFVDGISFNFPVGTVIPAGGYLVVAKDKERLMGRHPHLHAGNTVGNFGGRLSNSGERIALAMEVLRTVDPTMYVVVDEVTYRDGGRWGDRANRAGSSLELIDPRSDNRRPSNWAGSDESNKSEWVTIEHTGVMDHGTDSATELHIFIPAAGECLIDNIEVFTPGGGNRVANASFQNGLTGWIAQGNHVRTDLNMLEGDGDNRSLHLRATGGGDNGANRIKTVLTSTPSAGSTVTIRARARWLSGHPSVILRLKGNYLEAVGNLSVPENLGTPGLPNSALAANAGPAIYDVSHHPVLPAANEPVLVTARVHDPDGIGALSLRYRLDPSSTLVTVPMQDNGTGGDEVANDGVFTATIPGQAANTMVAWHIEAVDAHAAPAVSRYPDAAPEVEALVRFGESNPPGSFRSYRMWFTQATLNEWTSREKLSNERLPGTLVYGNRVIHGIGARYRGSPFIRPSYISPLSGTTIASLSVQVPRDDRMLGSREFNLDGLEQGLWGGVGENRDETLQREKTTFWMANQLGIPFSHQTYLYMFINGVRRGELYTDSQHINSDYLATWFPEDDGGELFKIDDWFEFSDSGSEVVRSFNRDARLENYTTTGGVKKQARYRWSWNKRSNRGLDDNYSNLFTLVDAVNTPGTDAYTKAVETVMDVEQWMRTFMLRRLAGDWDGYGYERGKNTWTYKPERDRWKLLPWDLDFSLGGGSRSPTHGLFSPAEDPTVARMYNHPPFRRTYLRAFHDAIEGPFQAGAMFPVLDEMYATFAANQIQVSGPGVIKNWVAARRTYVLDQLNAVAATFAITSNSGNDFSTAQQLLALEGTAPVAIKTITVNGHPYPITWTGVTTWRISLPLLPGANLLLVAGWDSLDQPVPGAAQSITVTYTGPGAAAGDHLVINEIMHQPATPDTEFVEIHNTSTTHAFDLTGHRLRGIDFDFPDGTLIEPDGFLVIVKNRHAFVAKYGFAIPIAGVYSGVLQPEGEQLRLVRLATVPEPELILSEVTYSATPPWPAAINDASLQLIDPTQDPRLPGNWAVADASTPPPEPQWRFVSASGIPRTASNQSRPLYIYLESAGEIYIDDLSVVLGTQPESGINVVNNGGFEGSLTGWTTVGNHGTSTASTAIKRSGSSSLHLVASGGGSANHSVRQDFSSSLTANATYTLSFWYRESTNGGPLVVRFSFSGITTTTDPAPTFIPSALATPGAPNSVATTLPAFPLVWLNEVQPDNLTGPTDNFGEREPWVELYNAGTNTVSLDGFYLADNYSNLAQWAFPAEATIGPGEFLIVWCDNQPHQTTGPHLHTNFRLPSGSGSVALSRSLGDTHQILDYLNYAAVPTNWSYGSLPDGQPFERRNFYFATPGAANNGLSPTPDLETHDLATGPYQFSHWSDAAAAGTYPSNMVFLQITNSAGDPGLTDEMDSAWTLPYNLTSRSRVNGLGAGGFAFLNTGSPQLEAGAGYLGAAVLALKSVGRENINVSWTGGTVAVNPRVYALRLQYRVGSQGPYADVLDPNGVPVEYLAGAIAGHAQAFGPVPLPAAANNQPYLEVRWKYYYVSGTSGARSQLRVADVAVTSSALHGEPPILLFQWMGGQMQLSWPSGTLQEADDADGPYTDVTASSPFIINPTEARKFFRIRL